VPTSASSPTIADAAARKLTAPMVPMLYCRNARRALSVTTRPRTPAAPTAGSSPNAGAEAIATYHQPMPGSRAHAAAAHRGQGGVAVARCLCHPSGADPWSMFAALGNCVRIRWAGAVRCARVADVWDAESAVGDGRPELVGVAGGQALAVDADLVVDEFEVLFDLCELGVHLGTV
jgi:hypothetical protein